MSQILVIDDDRDFREGLTETLSDAGFDCLQTDDLDTARTLIRQNAFRLVFLDLRLPSGDGMGLLRELHQQQRLHDIAVVVLTAFADTDNTIEAMKLGAFDHLTKPVGREKIFEIVQRCMTVQNTQNTKTVTSQREKLLGQSDLMRDVHKAIGLAAAHDNTVLISGETGTGKELVAQAIHNNSARANQPFIAINCAAIPADLLEGQLFGYEKGAFTGATHAYKGCFRQANGGTLFLDEIGDMPLSMQTKLLRILESRQVTPLGSSTVIDVDVRILAATHQQLSSKIQTGEFREDLFYRLNVLPINLPPLRKRQNDILLLAEHFLQLSGSHKKLDASAEAKLMAYPWPGNVRELRNSIERSAIMCRSQQLGAADILLTELPSAENVHQDQPLGDAVAQFEQQRIQAALQKCNGNRSAAARELGINRQLLYSKIEKYGLDSELLSD